MNYEITEHRYGGLDHVVLNGKHYYDVSLILEQQTYGDQCHHIFRPLLCDTYERVIWRAAPAYSYLEGIRQLGELSEAFVFTARKSGVTTFDMYSPMRWSHASG